MSVYGHDGTPHPDASPTGKGKTFYTDQDLKRLNSGLVQANERITQYHGDLMGKVDSLNDVIGEAMQKYEKDYLKAVETHMVSINTRIQQMKKRSGVKEIEAQKEEEKQKLQTALYWVKEEAVKLEEKYQKLRQENTKWKAKCESLEADKKFLEEQVKKAKRQLKSIFNPTIRTGNSSPPLLPQLTRPNPPPVQLPNTKAAEFLSKLFAKYSPEDPQLCLDIEHHLTAQEEYFNKTLAHYKRIISGGRRKINALNNSYGETIGTRSDMENLFIDCVKEVKSEMEKSRNRSRLHARSSSQASHRSDFSSNDKQKILQLLIDNEKVQAFLYYKLFPRKTNQMTSDERVEEVPEDDLQELRQLASAFDERKPMSVEVRGSGSASVRLSSTGRQFRL